MAGGEQVELTDEERARRGRRAAPTNPEGETADVRFVKGKGARAVQTLRERRGDVAPDRARHRPDGAGHQRAVRRGRPVQLRP